MRLPRDVRWRHAVVLLGALIGTASFGTDAPAKGPSLEALEAITAKASSLDDFLARPELVRAYGRALKSYYGRDHFRCETYEAILGQLTELKEKVPGLKERLWQRETLAPLTFAALGGGEQGGETDYVLHPVARRFHALWNDPSRQGCLSKVCKETDPTAPLRWAAALEKSRAYLVERRGEFADASLLLLPARLGKDTVGLVVISGSPLLRRESLYRTGKAAAARSASLVDLWAEAAGPMLGLKLLVERRSTSAGLKLVALYPRTAKLASDALSLEPADPVAAEITAALPQRCYGTAKKSARELFTGLNFSAEQLSGSTWAISPPAAPTAAEAEKARDLLLQFEYPTLGKLGVLADTDSEGVRVVLTNALRDPDPGIRARAALAIRSLDAIDIARHDGASTPMPELRLSGEGLHEALHHALSDPDPQVRGVAALALSGREKPGNGSGDLVTPMQDALSPANLPLFWPAVTVPSSPAKAGESPPGAPPPPRTASSPPRSTADVGAPSSASAAQPSPVAARPRNALDVINALGKELESRNVALSRLTLETLMERVAELKDPKERGQAEVKLARLVLRNPDAGASMQAVEAALEKHPKDLSMLPIALSESGARECRAPTKGKGQ